MEADGVDDAVDLIGAGQQPHSSNAESGQSGNKTGQVGVTGDLNRHDGENAADTEDLDQVLGQSGEQHIFALILHIGCTIGGIGVNEILLSAHDFDFLDAAHGLVHGLVHPHAQTAALLAGSAHPAADDEKIKTRADGQSDHDGKGQDGIHADQENHKGNGDQDSGHKGDEVHHQSKGVGDVGVDGAHDLCQIVLQMERVGLVHIAVEQLCGGTEAVFGQKRVLDHRQEHHIDVFDYINPDEDHCQ